MPNIDFEHALSEYKSQHQTAGCIITHMFGVPLIALSFPLFLINPRKSVSFFVLGWLLQLIGHYYYEHNKPVLFTRGKNVWVPFAALYMAARYWQAALTGNLSLESNNGKTKLLPYRR